MREEVATAIGNAIGATLQHRPAARTHGGSINECFRWESSAGPIFVKIAPIERLSMFEGEAAGLAELRRAGAVRVPNVLCVGSCAREAWLALEWLRTASVTRTTESLLGEQLASQHRFTSVSFGWSRDNTIGSTPQINQWSADWVSFY